MQRELLVLLITILTISSVITHFETPYTQQISIDDSFKFAWAIDPEDSLIRFILDVKTAGWAGLGISSTGTMVNSDMFMGYIQKDGKAVINDRYSTLQVEPQLDTVLGGKDDLINIVGSLQNGRTSITFERKFVTGDKFDMDIKQGQTYNIIFAVRTTGNPETENSFLQHTEKYTKSLVLYPKDGQSVTGTTTTTSQFIRLSTYLMLIIGFILF